MILSRPISVTSCLNSVSINGFFAGHQVFSTCIVCFRAFTSWSLLEFTSTLLLSCSRRSMSPLRSWCSCHRCGPVAAETVFLYPAGSSSASASAGVEKRKRERAGWASSAFTHTSTACKRFGRTPRSVRMAKTR